MFHFSGFASELTLRRCWFPSNRFPHSDISGSKLVCQLPEAFRRLPRPSSPVIAKASTTCTCSLDPITSVSLGHDRHRSEFSRLCRIPSHLSITLNTFWLIQSQPGIAFVLQRLINARDTFTTSHIVKEQPGLTPVGNSQRQTLRRLA